MLNSPLSGQAEHCLNLKATDSEGHSATVPLEISVPGGEPLSGGQNCQLFASETKLYIHPFEPRTEAEGEEEDLLIVTLSTSTMEEGEEQSGSIVFCDYK